MSPGVFQAVGPEQGCSFRQDRALATPMFGVWLPSEVAGWAETRTLGGPPHATPHAQDAGFFFYASCLHGGRKWASRHVLACPPGPGVPSTRPTPARKCSPHLCAVAGFCSATLCASKILLVQGSRYGCISHATGMLVTIPMAIPANSGARLQPDTGPRVCVSALPVPLPGSCKTTLLLCNSRGCSKGPFGSATASYTPCSRLQCG